MTDEVEEVAPKKSKTMLIVIIVVGVNVAIAGGVLAFTMGSGSAPAEEASPEKKRGAAKTSGEPGPLVKMDNFIVNIDSDEGRQYLKTAIIVELVGEDVIPYFEKMRMLVRNEMLMYLSSLDVESARTVKHKQAIQARLKKLINKRLGDELAVGVYFTEFVTQ
ncbi:MAG: hypothetical protein GY847_37995 [Proteobacteria bacterium]|nr:hypothetical protein [Pseudomonadota bacterium]